MAKGDSERIKKQIYSIDVHKTEFVDREVEIEEDGEKVLATKKVKEEIPYTVTLLKPTRYQDEEADLVYGIEKSRCVKAGVLTKNMLLNNYNNNGGMLSEDQSVQLQSLYASQNKKRIDYLELCSLDSKTQKQEEEIEKLSDDLTKISREIIDLEMGLHSLFDHTADTMAQNKTIVWYMLNLAYVYRDEESEEIDLLPLFPGEDFEEKRDSYYSMEEEGDNEIFNQIKKTLPAITSLWFLSKKVSQEDFKKLEETIKAEHAEEAPDEE